jgi:hypothetical protein
MYNFSAVTVEMIFHAATQPKLDSALRPICDALGYSDTSWFDPTHYMAWHSDDFGMLDRVETIMQWLLAVREGRA